MWEWIKNMIDRIFIVIVALIFLQFPLFMQQYTQQLTGRVAELQYQVSLMENAATISGKTLDEFVLKFQKQSDPDFSKQGEIMSVMVERWKKLSQSLVSIQFSSMVKRPFIFVWNLNYDIMKSSLRTFEPGIPLTFEAAVYAVIGIFLGYFIYQLLIKLILAIKRKVRHRS